MKRLSSEQLLAYWREGINIVDVRDPVEFVQGFLPGSFYCFTDRNFLFRIRSFLGFDKPLAIVAHPDQLLQTGQLLEKGGFRDIRGICAFNRDDFMEIGVPLDLIIDVAPEEFAMDLKYDERLLAVDLRSEQKYQLEHVKGSMSLPLMELTDIVQIANLDDNRNIYLFSENDQDALTAVSVLKKQGLHQARVVTGGWELIRSNDSIITEKVNLSGN